MGQRNQGECQECASHEFHTDLLVRSLKTKKFNVVILKLSFESLFKSSRVAVAKIMEIQSLMKIGAV